MKFARNSYYGDCRVAKMAEIIARIRCGLVIEIVEKAIGDTVGVCYLRF